MIHHLVFCLFIGLVTAYFLERVTNQLLTLYALTYSRQPIYYILTPILAWLSLFHIQDIPAREQILVYGLSYSFLCLLLLVAVMDCYTLEVRHRFVILIAVLGITQYIYLGNLSLLDICIGFFAASLPLLMVSILTQGSIGGGDIKLLASCGLVLGSVSVLLGTFLGIILGGIYGAFLLAFGKKNKQDALPFVPFLALGLGIAYLWCEPLITWYLSLF